MYKYIKGHEIYLEEHMYSATELAKFFGLYTLNNNPNGLLVCRILSDYVKSNNLNVSDYFYSHSHGVMKVYPSIVYDKSLSNFVFDLEENKEYFYIAVDENGKKFKIKYKYKKPICSNARIVSISERRKIDGRK